MTRRLVNARLLCGTNFVLLFTHQTEAVWWKEWEMFHLPGGIELFAAINMLFLTVALLAFDQVARNTRWARLSSSLFAAAGLITAALHTSFWASGSQRFTTLFSRAILFSILLCSVLQLWHARRG